MKIHDLMPNEGAKKNRKRKGIGISAGQGKTAGRGTKGQSSRTGSGGNLYRQGGNLPFYRRLPVVVMGRGEVKVALKVRVHRVTKSAKEKIEAAGGSVELIA